MYNINTCYNTLHWQDLLSNFLYQNLPFTILRQHYSQEPVKHAVSSNIVVLFVVILLAKDLKKLLLCTFENMSINRIFAQLKLNM